MLKTTSENYSQKNYDEVDSCPACCSVRRPLPDEKPEDDLPKSGFSKIKTRFNHIFHSVRFQVLLAVISAAALILSLFGSVAAMFPFHLGWIAILLCAPERFFGAIRALWRRKLSVDVLVSTAIAATIYNGEIFAGGEVALIMALGHLLEDWTVGRTRSGIEKLIKMSPKTARKVAGFEEIMLPVEEIRVGDYLKVLPGESIPLDGTIVNGNTSVDQQMITGEPLPVDKSVGEEVFAGTLNRFGAFTMRASQVVENSTISRMIQLVRSAEMKKAPMERITDRVASFLVPCAIVLALIVGLVLWNPTPAVTILVVFCPCSLILATPTAIVAAIGCASRYGILIRSGESLERLGKISALGFDKTGTLTLGSPQLTAAVSVDSDRSDEDFLALAAMIEQESEHPLSRYIVATAKDRGIRIPDTCEDSRVVPGRGIHAELVSGETVLLGNEKFLHENGIEIPNEALEAANPHIGNGATMVWGAVRSKVVGFIALEDTLRETAAATVRQLKDEKIEVILLSGDHANAAENVAAKVGVNSVYAGLLPHDKERIIEERLAGGTAIGMVGDGINDAPALKAADVGIAMGKMGSDLAIEAADVVLVGDDIARLPFLVKLARKTNRTIILNIALSMSINFIAIILAVMELIDPVIGALIHNFGSVAVTLNASMLLGTRMKNG